MIPKKIIDDDDVKLSALLKSRHLDGNFEARDSRTEKVRIKI